MEIMGMHGNSNYPGFTCGRGIYRKCVCCNEEFEIHSANHVRCRDCKAKGRKIQY